MYLKKEGLQIIGTPYQHADSTACCVDREQCPSHRADICRHDFQEIPGIKGKDGIKADDRHAFQYAINGRTPRNVEKEAQGKAVAEQHQHRDPEQPS